MTTRRSSGMLKALMGVGIEPFDAFLANSGLYMCAASAAGSRIYSLQNTKFNFVTLGFTNGGLITVTGTSVSTPETYVVSTVSAHGLLIAGSAGCTRFNRGSKASAYAVVQHKRGRLKDILRDGVIRIYTGTQPSSADSAESGTLLVELSSSAATFVPYKAVGGVEFGSASASAEIISKRASETWSGVAIATGVAGWFRFYANARETGASTTAIRFDGSVSTSGAQLNMSSTSITTGATIVIDTFGIENPYDVS